MKPQNQKFRQEEQNSVTDSRLFATAFLLLVFAGILALRLLYIQGIQNSKYSADALHQYLIKIPREGERGLIYDRHMQNLVINEACVSIGLDKSRMNASARLYARKLARHLSRSENWIYNRIRKVSGDFVWLERRVDTAIGSKIATLNLQGVRIEKDTRRNYPHQEVASHLLGFTDADNKGIEGVEYFYNDLFTGEDGWSLIQRDGRGRAVPEQVIREKEPVNGESIVLNIDLIYQTMATEELRTATRKYNATSGSVIVLDPNTGNILAMANEPSYNPNSPTQYSIAARRNRAVTDAFEPGSTFKIVPFAGLLEMNKLNPAEAVFAENGSYAMRGRTIRDTSPHGWLVPKDVLRYSSNIGTVKLTQKLGNEALYKFVKQFGFGKQTGIEFSGETAGAIRDVPEWSSFSQASIAIGQEVSVNALQVALAYAAIANGGNLLQPHLIRGVLKENGEIEKIPVTADDKRPRRILSAETATEIKKYLLDVVEEGTGKDARIPGVQIAGKTGTAQVPRSDGKGYSTSDFVSSFVGFFPVEQPQYLIYVVLHTDKANQWGSKAAVPTFQNIAKRISVNLQQPESKYTETTSKEQSKLKHQDLQQIVVPDVENRRFETTEAALRDLGLHTVSTGEGEFIKSQFPVAGTKLSPGDEIKLERFELLPSDGFTKMPKLIGLSLREALNKMAIANLEPMVYGNGKVVRQKPAPDTPIRAGIRCVIECETPEIKTPFFQPGELMQNMKWTLREVVTAWDYSYSLQNADNVLDQTIVAVSIDSRKMQPGDLFVAISGDVFDGHNFVKQALEKGALAAVVSKQWLQKNPGFAGRTLIVEDTLVALQKIAAAYRKKLNPFVFALTGTNGKTTTKEMIANVVSAEKTTHKTTGNLNNHIGVPLTLLAMREPVEVAVVEMGMNHAREILTLCEIAQPNAVLITNIGRGHTEFFGGLEGVKKAKQEIFDYIAPRGTACVNIDDTNVVRAAHDAGVALMCKYGFSPEAEIRGENLSLGEDGCARFSWNGAMIRVAIPGLHNGHNALAAIAAGSVTGISPAKIIDAVQKEIAVSGRMNKLEVGHRTVLDDSYNANPESMLAALGTLVSLPGKGKRYAALGDMLELGVLAEESHKSVLQAAIDKNLDFVFTYGPEMEKATKKLQNSRIRHFKSKDEIISEIQKMSEPGDVLLIKGSRGMRMEDILTALQNKLPV